MYSVVLATMLTAGSATPAWHHCHRACHSTCYAGYAGYSGYACSCSCARTCYSGCHRILPVFPHAYHHCHGIVLPRCTGCSGYVTYCHGTCSGTIVIQGCTGCCSTPKVIPVPDQKKEKKTTEAVALPTNSARVTINLPADARLWVENVECPLTGSVRTFNTPAINAGQQYFYNIRAEIVRDGRVISESQRVIITPGQESAVNFNTPDGIGLASTSR